MTTAPLVCDAVPIIGGGICGHRATWLQPVRGYLYCDCCAADRQEAGKSVDPAMRAPELVPLSEWPASRPLPVPWPVPT